MSTRDAIKLLLLFRLFLKKNDGIFELGVDFWTLLTIPPPLLNLVNFFPRYACIISDKQFCMKYAFQKCQQLTGFSFSRVRICITHYLYNTHVKNF